MIRIACWFVVFAAWSLAGTGTHAQDITDTAGNTVTVVFRVEVPASTPQADAVYLCGDHPALGNWDGRGFELDRLYDGIYEGRLTVEYGLSLQYKATRGSWDTVEKSTAGADIANRLVVADGDKAVEVIVEAWSSGDAKQPEPALAGDIRLHEGFRSEVLDNERTLIVYLPAGYREQPESRYPVLYMHDGQNIFDASTSFTGHEWMVDEAAERLIVAGRIEPIIIVGIYNNAHRMTEYTPEPVGDQADAYSRFVVEEVKPYIDQAYRTDPSREKTGVAGSSLGGLVSLYMVWAHADTFGRCAGVSPSLFWQDKWLMNQWRVSDMAWATDAKIWIDIGTREGRAPEAGGVTAAVQNARAMAGILEDAGIERGEGFAYREIKGGEHNEQAWSQRIDDILLYLYGTP